ncbi:tetratricopeptide repeat protein, partial [Streptomyces hydrogenans]|uniref:tetratricopeptide repeat protein n=1 Tax=Streptomyces hydrogenans TaxID=1873719 RepID=UPI00382BF42F
VVRGNLADWRGKAGDPAGAADAFAEVLTDRLRVLGPDHPHTLLTRYQWAVCTGQAGNPAGAVEALRELADDEARVYGSRNHAEVRNTLAELKRWQAILEGEGSARGSRRRHRQ